MKKDEDNYCYICLEELDINNCIACHYNHQVHNNCLKKWYHNHNNYKCLICKENINIVIKLSVKDKTIKFVESNLFKILFLCVLIYLIIFLILNIISNKN